MPNVVPFVRTVMLLFRFIHPNCKKLLNSDTRTHTHTHAQTQNLAWGLYSHPSPVERSRSTSYLPSP